MAATAVPEEIQRGNKVAEESLLAVAMAARPSVATNDAVDIVKLLDPREFQTPVNRDIAAAIIHLYDQRLPHDAVAVEDHLRARHQLPLALDSQAVQGRRPELVDRTELGLQKWEKYAGVYDNARYYATEVRDQYVAAETERIFTWGASMIRGGYASSEGVSAAYTSMVQQSVQEKLQALPKPLNVETSLPGMLAAGRRPPVNALDYAQPFQVSQTHSHAMDQALSRR